MLRRAKRPFDLGAILLAVAGLALTGGPALAEEPPTLSGAWSATSLREVWSTQTWGAACGPKPSGGGAPGGAVTIVQTGGELTISGAGRAWSTTECWEQLPGLRRVSHSGGKRGWSSRCASAAGDPRRVSIDTLTTATDDTIVFQETGVYEFAIAGETCKASVGRSRSFKLVQRAGAPPATSASAAPPPSATATASSAPAPSASAAPAPRCDAPGEVARIEVRPVHKLLRPGESFSLAVVARDAAGCALRVDPTLRWGGDAPPSGLRLEGVRVSAADDASDGVHAIVVDAAGRRVSVRVEVVRPDRYAELVAERGLSAEGEDARAAVAEVEAGLGGGTTLAEDVARQRKLVFVLVVAALALPLALVGLARYRRSRRREPAAPPPSLRASTLPNVELFDAPASGQSLRCGRCGRVYPPGSAGFCEDDGAPLRPASRGAVAERAPLPPAAPVSAPAPEEPPRSVRGSAGAALICPECGKRYGAGATFCGEDGARLAPMH